MKTYIIENSKKGYVSKDNVDEYTQDINEARIFFEKDRKSMVSNLRSLDGKKIRGDKIVEVILIIKEK